jgi:hypothetical protein
VILGAAVLGDEVHLRPALQPVLRRVGAHLHVHFGDRVHVGGAAEIPATAARSAAVTAVDAVDVDRLTACRALNGRHRRGEAAAERFLIVGQQRDTGQDLQQRDRVAAANRQVGHLLEIEHRLMRRLGRRQELADRADGDRFVEFADVQLQRSDGEAVVALHDVRFDLKRLETRERHSYGVRSRGQGRKDERADFVGDRAPFLPAVFVDDRDVGARKHLTRTVDDDAGHRARHRLRRPVDGDQQQHQYRREPEQPHATPHSACESLRDCVLRELYT